MSTRKAKPKPKPRKTAQKTGPKGKAPRNVGRPEAVRKTPERASAPKPKKARPRSERRTGKKPVEPGRGRDVVPWSQRFKDNPTGPWTCPKCGPLSQKAQPLYGEDERHHCPNVDCDAVVTLLSKEDLEPSEKRTGSWPPQRNKNRPVPEPAGED